MIYSSYQVNVSTCLKSFHFLCTYPGKVFSAWAEVWSMSWPSTASIMAPGGRDLGNFRVSGRADDIEFSPIEDKSQHRIISAPWYICK